MKHSKNKISLQKKQARKRNRNIQQIIFDEVIHVIEMNDINEISEAADVSISTLHNWVNKKTKSPRLITLYKVSEAIGIEFTIAFSVSSTKSKFKLI